MKNFVLLLVASLFIATIQVSADTLILKDGTSMTKVKIVSINFAKNFMVVESDGQQRTISTSRVAEVYDTDRKGAGAADIDNTSDYDVMIMNMDMPKTGYIKHGGKKKTFKTSACEISFSIRRLLPKKDQKTNPDLIKYPYFYLAVMTEGDGEYGGRPIFRYTYPPKQFKLDSNAKKSYNTAAIMDAISSLKRSNMHLDRAVGFNSKSSNNLAGERNIKIELKDVKDRRIIAYHLEVWGKDKIVANKDWTDPGTHIASGWKSRWWMGH